MPLEMKSVVESPKQTEAQNLWRLSESNTETTGYKT